MPVQKFHESALFLILFQICSVEKPCRNSLLTKRLLQLGLEGGRQDSWWVNGLKIKFYI